jgi:hypothetical protein
VVGRCARQRIEGSVAVVLSELERRSVETRIEKEQQRRTWQAAMDHALVETSPSWTGGDCSRCCSSECIRRRALNTSSCQVTV